MHIFLKFPVDEKRGATYPQNSLHDYTTHHPKWEANYHQDRREAAHISEKVPLV